MTDYQIRFKSAMMDIVFEPLFPCHTKKSGIPRKDIGFFYFYMYRYFNTTSTLRAPWAPITSACSMSAVFEGPEINTP